MKLAMQPDVAFELESEYGLRLFLKRAEAITDREGKPIIKLRYPPKGKTLNLSLQRSERLAVDGTVLFEGESYALQHFGLKLFDRDQGTGYHQPDGIWLWRGAAAPSVAYRQTFDSRAYAPTLLQAFGVTPPGYMMPSLYSAPAARAVSPVSVRSVP